MAHCDHGWIHVCGGPHTTELVEQDQPTYDENGEVTGAQKVMVSVMATPYAEGGCQTVRCTEHCSCFAPEGEHEEECAL